MTTFNPAPAEAETSAIEGLRSAFAAQKEAFRRNGPPSVQERQGHLGALIGMVMGAREQIQDAVAADFAVHPHQLTTLSEVLGVAGQAMYAAEQLPEWAAPQERVVDPNAFGSASAAIEYQPKGVTGIISPWNFPFLLALGPLVDMLAAGNRVIIKPSEHAPASAELLRELVARTFDPDHVTVACGGADLARTFTTLTWDHLLYTGNATVGREVAVAAARNLVPVTLELGGKNPAIVHSDSVDAETVAQIVGGKLAKNGQVCIATDYCLVPRSQLAEFVELARDYVARAAPGYSSSTDCTGIISERHLERLEGMLQEATDSGCEVVSLEPGAKVDRETRQMPISLLIDPAGELAVMREEIFGPLLPVRTYDTIDEAIEYVNAGDRPLGLYVFARDPKVARTVLDRTISGGACVNTTAVQGVLPSLGFGGSGASGYGRHRGVEGFREFSNARGVVVRGEGDAIAAFFPPYSGVAQAIVDATFGG